MIIDAHTHIYESGKGGPFDIPAGADDLTRTMDDCGIDISLVIPLPGVASNVFVSQECARFPDRLAYLYTPDFVTPSDTLGKMHRFFDAHSPKGIKIHPRCQGVSATDTIVRETLAYACELGLPAVFDVFPFGPDFAEDYVHPKTYCHLARDMPDLTIVLAHAGGYKVLDAFLAAKAYANILLDISFTPSYFAGSSLTKDLRFACARLPAGKVIYGSDFPDVELRKSLSHARDLAEDIDQERCEALLSGHGSESL